MIALASRKRIAIPTTTRAEKSTQAILAKAFRGELVPTEAELARREGRAYEPASALLERIRGCGPILLNPKPCGNGLQPGRTKVVERSVPSPCHFASALN